MKFYLAIIGAAILVTASLLLAGSPVEDYGWTPPPATRQPLTSPPPAESGQGKIRLLYRDWQEATGYVYIPRRQGPVDCVGQSTAAALDMRMAVQALNGLYQVPQHETDASSIYGLSRVEIGDADFAHGSFVKWAMKAVSEYGLLYKKNYLYAGYDLSRYSSDRSVNWGRNGLPSVLERIAKLTPVIEYYQVHNYEEVRDAIAAGYPVVVGSDMGFNRPFSFWNRGGTKSVRDDAGFLQPRGIWKHAQAFIGVDDKSRRKGVCCLNSWGKSWVSGPTKLNQPPGSYWIDDDNVTLMAQQGDAFAIVQVNSPLEYRLTL